MVQPDENIQPLEPFLLMNYPLTPPTFYPDLEYTSCKYQTPQQWSVASAIHSNTLFLSFFRNWSGMNSNSLSSPGCIMHCLLFMQRLATLSGIVMSPCQTLRWENRVISWGNTVCLWVRPPSRANRPLHIGSANITCPPEPNQLRLCSGGLRAGMNMKNN